MYNNCYRLARVWAACGPADENKGSRPVLSRCKPSYCYCI